MGYAIEDEKKVWREPSKKWKKVRESQGIKQPKKPKNVKSSGTYGGGSSSSSKKSSSSSSRSRSSSERTESVYRPGDEKKSYLGDVKKQQITKKTSKPKKTQKQKVNNRTRRRNKRT